jgi:hypothetical protein
VRGEWIRGGGRGDPSVTAQVRCVDDANRQLRGSRSRRGGERWQAGGGLGGGDGHGLTHYRSVCRSR